MLSLVTVSPVITAFHSCCLSHHVFDQQNLLPAWIGIETMTMLTWNHRDSTSLSAAPRARKSAINKKINSHIKKPHLKMIPIKDNFLKSQRGLVHYLGFLDVKFQPKCLWILREKGDYFLCILVVVPHEVNIISKHELAKLNWLALNWFALGVLRINKILERKIKNSVEALFNSFNLKWFRELSS